MRPMRIYSVLFTGFQVETIRELSLLATSIFIYSETKTLTACLEGLRVYFRLWTIQQSGSLGEEGRG